MISEYHDFKNSTIDKDFLLEVRRNAYVECTENYLEKNTIVGIFGDDLPEELFYACDVLPIPMEGVDPHIFKFAKKDEWAKACDVIKSTLIYLQTQKCPILYSCKMYVLQPSCKTFINAIKANTKKPVLVYSNEENLIESICQIYATSYKKEVRDEAKADLDYIQGVLQKVKYYSNLDCESHFLLEFYSKYIIDIKMRRAYFEKIEQEILFTSERRDIKEVCVICPRGNYAKCLDLSIKNFEGEDTSSLRIKRVWDYAFYGYNNCPFECKKKIGY